MIILILTFFIWDFEFAFTLKGVVFFKFTEIYPDAAFDEFIPDVEF
jgi:hypothetical protein